MREPKPSQYQAEFSLCSSSDAFCEPEGGHWCEQAGRWASQWKKEDSVSVSHVQTVAWWQRDDTLRWKGRFDKGMQGTEEIRLREDRGRDEILRLRVASAATLRSG